MLIATDTRSDLHMGVDYSCRQRSLAVCESLQHEQRVECQHRRLPQQQQREQLVSGAAGLCLIGLQHGLHIVLIVRSRFRHKESNPMPFRRTIRTGHGRLLSRSRYLPGRGHIWMMRKSSGMMHFGSP